MDEGFLVTMMVTTGIVLLTVLVHYESLRLITRHVLPTTRRWSQPHFIVIVTCVFLAHTVEVWLFALCYYLMVEIFGLGGLAGDVEGTLVDYVYFSVVSYTSLGLGDLYPVGYLRLLTGVEALSGLLMIGWSASYTYLVMRRHWNLE